MGCLAHPQAMGIFHYHSASPCLAISKDGRPILGPYKQDGTSYSDCDVDACNGVELDGSYMYATTFFHPYIMGCYGKGSNPSVSQQCSSNPRNCTTSALEPTAAEFLQ